MEERRLITPILIITLIIITMIGFSIYKIYTVEKILLNNSENNIIDNNNVNANNILQHEVAEKMAKKILDEYIKLIDYENNNIGPMPYILVEMGLETEENIKSLTLGISDSTTYIKSNTKYEDFKETLLQYVTENYFLEKFSQYKNIDGKVAFCNCRASNIPVEVEKIILKSVTDNQYTFNVTFKDIEMYEHYLKTEDGENVTENDYLFNNEISFEYINNKLVISQWK